ncbi:MAG: C69 family dipeptidase, partial [bacterium]|nr:C69 family dipeptidase [bacterium]
MFFNKLLTAFLLLALLLFDNINACTTIMVGKKASKDGSVIVAYASDSRTSRTWFNIVPRQKHKSGALCSVYKNTKLTKSPTDLSAAKFVGNISQVAESYKYINTSYPLMNENQLMIGESTFGGRDTLRNKDAMFTIEELCRIVQERATTARQAIRIIDELTKEFGYNDTGEHLAIGDKNEIWHLEILGCGHDKVGAIWAAQRVPDDHVAVDANGSRIRKIDLNDPDNFMASDNVFSVAEEYGWWSPESGQPFEFCYAYAPDN